MDLLVPTAKTAPPFGKIYQLEILKTILEIPKCSIFSTPFCQYFQILKIERILKFLLREPPFRVEHKSHFATHIGPHNGCLKRQ